MIHELHHGRDPFVRVDPCRVVSRQIIQVCYTPCVLNGILHGTGDADGRLIVLCGDLVSEILPGCLYGQPDRVCQVFILFNSACIR